MKNTDARGTQRVTFKSPQSRKKKSVKRKSKQKDNKENDRLKLLQKAADIAESKHSAEDMDFLNKVMEETKFAPKTPSQEARGQAELMRMFSKESEQVYGTQDKGIAEIFLLKSEARKDTRSKNGSSSKYPRSPVREFINSGKKEQKGKAVNIEQCLKEIKVNERKLDDHTDEETKKKLKLNISQVSRFNERVRKANSKLGKKRKSRARKNSNEPQEKERSGSRNSSLGRLKNRISKRIGQSHLTAEKKEDSEEAVHYDPKKRGIGMDFLEFVKKKPSTSTHKLFLSTQKTGSEWSAGNRFEKQGKKIRPNSAQQTASGGGKLKSFEDVFSMNEDLDAPIVPINEMPEETITNRVSDELQIIEKVKTLKNHASQQQFMKPGLVSYDSNNDNASLSGREMKPVYEYEEDKNNHIQLSEREKRMAPGGVKGKRKSRSKNRKDKPSQERKESRNSSMEAQKPNIAKSVKDRKSSMPRPFSGGPEKPFSEMKTKLKSQKPKQRPKTAKQGQKSIEPELKSPSSKKFLSPKSSKKTGLKKSKTRQMKSNRSSRKKSIVSSKNNRKTSLSPNTEATNDMLFDTKLGLHKNNPSGGNRKIMNDIHSKFEASTSAVNLNIGPESEIPINILTNNFVRDIKDHHVVLIQKFLRGYAVYSALRDYRLAMQEQALLTKKSGSSSSENTFARATNQNDILHEMLVHKAEEDKEQIVNDYKGKHPDGRIEIIRGKKDLQPSDKKVKEQPRVMKKPSREGNRIKIKDNKQSKSVTSFEKADDEEEKSKRSELINKSLRLLKKKRPFSAKVKNQNLEKQPDDVESTEKLAQIMNTLKTFKAQRNLKKVKTETEIKPTVNKPPIGGRNNRNEKNNPYQKSTDSLSEKMSQISPSATSNFGFSTDKYQQILK